MVEHRADQADGLRRMFRGEHPRVFELIAGRPGVGRTSVAANLGVALARSGRDTLLIDYVDRTRESRALRYLGVCGQRGTTAGESAAISVPGAKGLEVLALSREAAESACADFAAGGFADALSDPAAAHDCVLICGAFGQSAPLPLAGARREVLVVVSRAHSSITDAYALIKRISGHGTQRFHVIVNRVHADAHAQQIFHNLARVAHGYLDVQLSLLGFIPADGALERAAAQGCSVLDASPCAPSALAFRRLAVAICGSMPVRMAPEPTPAEPRLRAEMI